MFPTFLDNEPCSATLNSFCTAFYFDTSSLLIPRLFFLMPQTEALLVPLYYINDLPIKEIHEITGLSKPNIKIKLFRARKKLEHELAFLLDDKTKVNNEQE